MNCSAGYKRYRWNLLNSRIDRCIRSGRREVCAASRRLIQRARLNRSDASPETATHSWRAIRQSWASFYFDNFYSAFTSR